MPHVFDSIRYFVILLMLTLSGQSFHLIGTNTQIQQHAKIGPFNPWEGPSTAR